MRLGWAGIALVMACTGSKDKDEDATDRTVTDGDGDTDADADGDADSDTDTDTDADGNTDPTELGLDCDADYSGSTPAPGSAGQCFTQVIACGDLIYGTTVGGDATYDADYWITRQMSSTLDAGDLAGPERVYLFEGLAAGEAVTFDVVSCDDVWGTTMTYGDVSGDMCDTSDTFTTAQHFSGTGTTSMQAERLNGTVSGDYDLTVIVDTLTVETSYAISVTCGDHQ